MYLLYRFGILSNSVIKVVLNEGCIVPVELDRIGRIINAYYDGLISNVHCFNNNLYVDFMGLKFRDVFRSMVEVFVNNEWSFLNVKGRHVIDVGAFNGDSSIYFVISGAEKIIAVEPHPKAFLEMLMNIKLNNLSDRIVPINVALGKCGFIGLPIDISLDDVIDKIYERKVYRQSRVVKVKSIKLSDLLDLINVRTDVLKLDCEGCEFDVIESDYSTIRLFRELGIEFHLWERDLREYVEIIKNISKDFKCRNVKIYINRVIAHCVHS
jgi:FkbM family methyltransferase